jgi:small subunit ribosomal protein S8
MPVNDPIGDLLTRIRNAQHVRNAECRCPWSRHKQEICEVLRKEGMLRDIEVVGEGKDKEIIMRFSDDRPKLSLKRVSKPGRRVYLGKGDLKPVLQGYGVAVVTTSQGVMTDKEAREKKIGGEVLCTVS